MEDDIECLVETNTMEQIHEPIKLYEIIDGSGTQNRIIGYPELSKKIGTYQVIKHETYAKKCF